MEKQTKGTAYTATWKNGGEGKQGEKKNATLTIERVDRDGLFPVTTLVYDGTFGGFLTAVFVVYSEYRGEERIDIIPPSRHQPGIFMTERIVDHDPILADRVWSGLLRHLTPEQAKDIYATFLGESPARKSLMLDYIRKVFLTEGEVAGDYLDETARMIRVWGRRLKREKAHQESTIRFHESSTGEYYALIEPEYNVLPLITDYFRERFEDPWVIYDIRRAYGVHFDGTRLQEVTLDGDEGDTRHIFGAGAPLREPRFRMEREAAQTARYYHGG